MMRRSVWLFLFLVLCGRAAVAWAGPAEEIAQVDEQAVKALNDGNLDAYMALHADDAVLTPSGAPFRIEGKEVVRSFFAGLFQNFPTRRFVERQRTIRVYGDSTGILNAYFTVTLVDRAGAVNTVHARMSVTFVRMGGRWLVADDHASRLPQSAPAAGFQFLEVANWGWHLSVPFSCKGRGFCPSCGSRRMTESAARLVDEVLPRVPVRQWMLSLPYRLRYDSAGNFATAWSSRGDLQQSFRSAIDVAAEGSSAVLRGRCAERPHRPVHKRGGHRVR